MAASDEDLQQFMAITSCDASMAASMLEVRCYYFTLRQPDSILARA